MLYLWLIKVESYVSFTPFWKKRSGHPIINCDVDFHLHLCFVQPLNESKILELSVFEQLSDLTVS